MFSVEFLLLLLSLFLPTPKTMESILIDCVQKSLNHFMHSNAIFISQRLCAHFPSEVFLHSHFTILVFFHLLYIFFPHSHNLIENEIQLLNTTSSTNFVFSFFFSFEFILLLFISMLVCYVTVRRDRLFHVSL